MHGIAFLNEQFARADAVRVQAEAEIAGRLELMPRLRVPVHHDRPVHRRGPGLRGDPLPARICPSAAATASRWRDFTQKLSLLKIYTSIIINILLQ